MSLKHLYGASERNNVFVFNVSSMTLIIFILSANWVFDLLLSYLYFCVLGRAQGQQLVIQEGLQLTGCDGCRDNMDDFSPGGPGALGLGTVLPGVALVAEHIPGGGSTKNGCCVRL